MTIVRSFNTLLILGMGIFFLTLSHPTTCADIGEDEFTKISDKYFNMVASGTPLTASLMTRLEEELKHLSQTTPPERAFSSYLDSAAVSPQVKPLVNRIVDFVTRNEVHLAAFQEKIAQQFFTIIKTTLEEAREQGCLMELMDVLIIQSAVFGEYALFSLIGEQLENAHLITKSMPPTQYHLEVLRETRRDPENDRLKKCLEWNTQSARLIIEASYETELLQENFDIFSTLIRKVCSSGSSDLLKIFLEAARDVKNYNDEKELIFALFDAAVHGQANIVKELLNAISWDKYSAIFVSIGKKMEDTSQLSYAAPKKNITFCLTTQQFKTLAPQELIRRFRSHFKQNDCINAQFVLAAPADQTTSQPLNKGDDLDDLADFISGGAKSSNAKAKKSPISTKKGAKKGETASPKKQLKVPVASAAACAAALSTQETNHESYAKTHELGQDDTVYIDHLDGDHSWQVQKRKQRPTTLRPATCYIERAERVANWFIAHKARAEFERRNALKPYGKSFEEIAPRYNFALKADDVIDTLGMQIEQGDSTLLRLAPACWLYPDGSRTDGTIELVIGFNKTHIPVIYHRYFNTKRYPILESLCNREISQPLERSAGSTASLQSLDGSSILQQTNTYSAINDPKNRSVLYIFNALRS